MPAPDLLLTPQDLTEIVESVSRTLAQVVKSEKDRLAKNDDGDDKPDDSDPAMGEPPAEGSAPAGAPPGAPGDDALDGPPPSDEGSAPGGDPAQSQAPDPAALKAEYAALPPDQLKMHVEAAQAALAEAMGGGDAPAPADAGAPPGAPAPGGPGGPPPAMKSQASMGGSGGESVKVLKSEVTALGEKLKAKDAELTELRKNLEVATEGLGKLAGAFEAFNGRPQRKAVTELRKSETPQPVALDPKVVHARLRAKIRDTTLSKSDRENINVFLLDPKKADLAAIANLLKD